MVFRWELEPLKTAHPREKPSSITFATNVGVAEGEANIAFLRSRAEKVEELRWSADLLLIKSRRRAANLIRRDPLSLQHEHDRQAKSWIWSFKNLWIPGVLATLKGSEKRHAENCWGVLPKRVAKGLVCSVIQGAAGRANSQLITSPFLQSLRGLFRARWTGGFAAQIIQFILFAVENKSWEIKSSLLYIFFRLIRYGHGTNWLCNLGNHAQMLGFAAAFSDQMLVWLELAGSAGANPARWGCRGDWLNALINLPEPDPDVFSSSSTPRIWKAFLWVECEDQSSTYNHFSEEENEGITHLPAV